MRFSQAMTPRSTAMTYHVLPDDEEGAAIKISSFVLVLQYYVEIKLVVVLVKAPGIGLA